MRQLGSLNSITLTNRFRDYLVTERISCQIENEGESFVIWILDEDKLDQAREAFQKFQVSPDADEFLGAHQQAEEIRNEQIRQVKQAIKRQVDVRKNWEPPGNSDLIVTYVLIAISVLVTLKFQMEGSSFGIFSKLTIAEIHDVGAQRVQWNRNLQEIQDGEIWRLVTPIFPHMDPLHLLFNMYWMYLFGKLLEPRMGHWRFLLLVLTTAICSNLVQFYWANPMFGGMSGVLYAVFGFTWAKRDWEPHRGIWIDQTTVYLLVGWMFFCMLGLMPVANAAHVSGLVSGYLIAIIRPIFHKLVR